MRKAIIIISVVVIIISILGISYIFLNQKEYTDNISSLEEKLTTNEDPVTEEKLEVPVDFTLLSTINSDIKAWVKIENTNLSYPVMQNSDDGEYYLDRNFYYETDPNGLPFLDERNSSLLDDESIIIYGHNMKSGLVFHSLESYEDENYYNKNQTIILETPTGRRTFKIFSVIKEKINQENSFDYNMFTNFNSDNEKSDFVKNAIDSSLYPINEQVDISAPLLTLSTCDNITMDGRIAVIGFEVL